MSAIAQHAAGFVGLEENPGHKNRSPLIDSWNERVGSDLGSPWCMAFAWCMGQDVYQERWKNKRSGSVEQVYEWARDGGHLVDHPEPDDFICVWHADLGRYAHTGIVESVEDGTVTTIEGNTNDDGSRDGYKVCRHTRKIAGLKFVRPLIVEAT